MHVSDWPKRRNMVPRPNLGGNSTFLHHDLVDRGVLPCTHIHRFSYLVFFFTTVGVFVDLGFLVGLWVVLGGWVFELQ